MDVPDPVEGATTTTPPAQLRSTSPRWDLLALSLLIFGLLTLPLLSEGVALYWYAFPLFGIGATYVYQFATRISRVWWITAAVITPLSIVALVLEWPFSGHVLWNILFLRHSATVVRSRRWVWVLAVSLVHLMVLKVAFQTPKDVVGAVISAALAGVIILVIRRVERPAG